MWVQSLGWEDPLEQEMATHLNIFAQNISWTDELGRLQSMGLQRVGHDLACATTTSSLMRKLKQTAINFLLNTSVVPWTLGVEYLTYSSIPVFTYDKTGASERLFFWGPSPRKQQSSGLIPGILHSRRRKWQPTPVFLPGESQGRRSLVGCCLWGHTESDTTEATQQQQQQHTSFQSSKRKYLESSL